MSPWTTEHVGSPALSPDGRRDAFTPRSARIGSDEVHRWLEQHVRPGPTSVDR